MIDKPTEFALIFNSPDETDLFSRILKQLGYERVTSFGSTTYALDVALRKQFQVFITRLEMPEMSGLTFVQKLRQTGNYGLETHFFIGENLDDKVFSVLYEFDINYVLTKPFTQERIVQKLNHLCREEASLSDFEKGYRDAKAAFQSNLIEMALELGVNMLKKYGPSEKLLVFLGDIKCKQSDTESARKFYDAALKINGLSAAANHKLARTYMIDKDYSKAAELMNRLTSLNPYNIELLANAGLSNFEIGNLEKAKEFAKSLKTLDKKSRPANETLAKVGFAEKNYKEAFQYLTESYSQKELIQFLNNAGVKLSQGDDVQGALEMYQQCLDVVRDNEHVHAILYNMGIGYAKLKDFKKARKAFMDSLLKKPDYEKAISALKNLPPE